MGRAHDLRFHPMFGGLMAYFEEKPCAWLSAQGLALKLDVADQDALLTHAGAARFRHREGTITSRGYVIVPPALCRDTGQLAEWLLRSSRAARTPKKRPRPKARPV
nr:TfoX/Sxy family protein [Dyella sp. ASV21]